MSQQVVLKAGLVPLTTLSFNSSDEDAIRAELEQKRAEAPALFRHLPCVIDLTGLDPDALPLSRLLSLCRDNGLLVVGVRNASDSDLQQAASEGLADLGKGTTRTAARQESLQPADVPARQVKVHSGNIRSGQQLYTDGDLIILGMVSNGAEVLASGDIHIYGALRGRALAGVKGDENAIVACQQFDAELVAIAGQYRLFESAPEQRNQSVVVSLSDGNLNITSV
ncbi:septum site-determining protein MinC [Thalassolituus sp. LLYu03]|uniref:septum site-determining protein MinC n=1 Tax=Thalassolituus sp. LLYu03 TaxID=3421656 RepID=UPI003D297FB4